MGRGLTRRQLPTTLIYLSNRGDHDQRRVWVPFHFIPGNVGTTYTERLKLQHRREHLDELPVAAVAGGKPGPQAPERVRQLPALGRLLTAEE